MAKKTEASSASPETYRRFDVEDLLLDPENPRLIELGLESDATQADLLKALWEKMAVEELAMSIAYNGYFNHEPLFLLPKGKKWIVIEGNRRLAAVKLLLDEKLRKELRATDLPNIDEIDEDRRVEISSLPGFVTTREDAWRYLGFKHVNGPSTWGSYAKAQYIATVHNDFKVPLDDIAKQIGDYSSTVERMYRGLMVIEQAESAKVFSRQNTSKNKFFFNYIYTGLDNPNIRAFLGLEGTRSDRKPVPPNRIKQLGELCEWLYGNEAKGKASLIKSQNPDLGILGQVLTDEKGIKALRDGLPLRLAHEISQGDERLFSQALHDAKQSLQRAHGTLSTGFTPGDSEAVKTATEIDDLASDLLEEMLRKRKRESRRKKAKSSDD